MNVYNVDIYSLFHIKPERFKLDVNYNICYKKLDNPFEIKKLLEVELGFLVNGKKYLKLYLLELAQNLYISKFISKNNLFFIIMDAILIKNKLFVFPISESEITVFNELYKKSIR